MTFEELEKLIEDAYQIFRKGLDSDNYGEKLQAAKAVLEHPTTLAITLSKIKREDFPNEIN